MASSAPGANAKRPIVIRKIKKVAGGHHGGAWKVAYADFVTAMMAFFMLLWLISNPDKQRLKGLAEYFSPPSASTMSQSDEASASASGVGGMPGSGGYGRRAQAETTKDPSGRPGAVSRGPGAARGGTAAIPDASLRVLAQEMKVAIDTLPRDEHGNRAMRVEEDREGLRISLMDSAQRSMFASGTATLTPFARETLARVAGKLMRSESQIAVEGHTDGTDAGDAGWRLSGERAMAARSAMVAAGLPPARFAEVVALSNTRPVYPDQPDRPENRRITIVARGSAPALPADASFAF